ncbi:hypothetical protein JTE90_011270 [Oedothorax gibbosus]|uniref:Senescence-associated protein n=1 Tax=Oedothorax gibbosus TaxID=931172 RepID=A0AAV6TJT0_9ARAC|nr:hypothetical protein JTE90_011270 [Oedothorax gibbosus]
MVASHHWPLDQAHEPSVRTCGSSRTEQDYYRNDESSVGIGRADIEGSKSNVAMNAWLPRASYPCGNSSDTSCIKLVKSKGSIGHAFAVRIHTGKSRSSELLPFCSTRGFCPR